MSVGRVAQGAYHYAIAPKDDMPLALFLECLGVVCGKTNLQLDTRPVAIMPESTNALIGAPPPSSVK